MNSTEKSTDWEDKLIESQWCPECEYHIDACECYPHNCLDYSENWMGSDGFCYYKCGKCDKIISECLGQFLPNF
jgi:hypothetical protein